MNQAGWPEVRAGRLGAGVVLEAAVLWSFLDAGDKGHDRVTPRLLALAEAGTPLAVTYPTLVQVAVQAHGAYGADAAACVIARVRESLNVLAPAAEDMECAEDVLAQGVERLTLEQALAGAVARRLGCSVYGSSPAYHLFHVAVIVD